MTNRPRILHLIDTGGPGGAETVLLNLVTGLDQDHWEHYVSVPLVDWLSGSLVERGIPIMILPSEGAFDVRYLNGIVRMIRDLRVDLVQTHLFTTAVYGAVAGALTRVPIVSTIHGIVDTGEDNLKRKMKFRLIDRPANRIVLVSRLLKEAIAGQARLREEIQVVVPNGIDVSVYQPVRDTAFRRELGVPDDGILVGALGNVRAPKDYGTLLEAAAILRARSPRWRFVLVGDTLGEPEIYKTLVAKHEALSLGDTFTFAGFRPDAPRLLNNLDLYVMSSEREGLPLALAQAMATGLPVVSTRAGGAQELVTPGLDGLLVPTRDPSALATALESLAVDPVLAARMGEAARRTIVEHFGMSRMVERYGEIYRELIYGRRA